MLTEKQKEYRKYLATDGWKERSEKIKNIWGNKCPVCFFKGVKNTSLNSHHLNYDSLGNEGLQDVIPLCKLCHTNVHTNILKIFVLTKEESEALNKLKDSLNISECLVLPKEQDLFMRSIALAQQFETINDIEKIANENGKFEILIPVQPSV